MENETWEWQGKNSEGDDVRIFTFPYGYGISYNNVEEGYEGSTVIPFEAVQVIAARQKEEMMESQYKIYNELWDKKQNELHGGYDDAEYLQAYCDALDDYKGRLESLN